MLLRKSLLLGLLLLLVPVAAGCAPADAEDDTDEATGASSSEGLDAFKVGVYEGSRFEIALSRAGSRLYGQVCDTSCYKTPSFAVSLDNGSATLTTRKSSSNDPLPTAAELTLSASGSSLRVKGTIVRTTTERVAGQPKSRTETFAIDETLKLRPTSEWNGTYRSVDGLGEMRIERADEGGATVTWNGRTTRMLWSAVGNYLDLLPMSQTTLGPVRTASPAIAKRLLKIQGMGEPLVYEKTQ